ncbi:MAG TPA: TolC family protein [Dissulfurispiraceae bacterium]|nr:TolC family protein [Dissulfurispiraceae bacterium]
MLFSEKVMSYFQLSLAACAVFFTFVQPAAGVERALTLKESVALALSENHDLKALSYNLDAEAENVGIARSAWFPHLSFEERFMRTDNPTAAFAAKLNQGRFAQQDFAVDSLNNPRPINDFQSSFSAEQLVFSGKALFGLDMSKIMRDARKEELLRKRHEIAFQVVRTFLSVQTAMKYVGAAEQGVRDAEEHRRIAQLRYDSGLGLYSDVLRASTGADAANQALVSARTNMEVAKRALGLLLGMPDPVDVSDEAADIQRRDIAAYISNASVRNDVRAMELHLENARKNVSFAGAGYLPEVGVGGSYQRNDHRQPLGGEGDSWTVQAFLRWNIFDGFKREHERSRAKFQLSETEERLVSLKQAVLFKIYEAYLNAEEARKNEELAGSALKTAEEGKRLVELRYQNSLAPLVDLLDSQANLDHQRAAYIARSNDYRLASANLSFQGGLLLQDLGLEQ